MTSQPTTRYHIAYAFRSFEHQKRHTYHLILDIARALDQPLDVFDLSCGPGVLDGILISELPGRIKSLHLADIDPGFLRVAQEHLAPLGVPLNVHAIDLTRPETLPDLTAALDLVVSTNALFHATPSGLEHVYQWVFKALRPGGVLVNHQNTGNRMRPLPSFMAKVFDVTPRDTMDREFNRRSQLEQRIDAASASPQQGPVYSSLHLTSDVHLSMLAKIGFNADEVWRFGNSVVLAACRPA